MIRSKELVMELVQAGVPAIAASSNGRVALTDGRVIGANGKPDFKFGNIEQLLLDKYASVIEAHKLTEGPEKQEKPHMKTVLTALIKMARGKLITEKESNELDKLDI